jgi:hypothetical protein
MPARTSIRGRRRHAGVLGVLTIALSLAGCAASPARPSNSPSASASRLALTKIDTAASAMGCDQHRIVTTDLNHYDDLAGIDCFYSGGDTVLLRIYSQDTSPDQVLVDLVPTFDADNQVAVGANWFATGTPRRIVDALRALGVDARPSSRYVPRPKPLSAAQEYVGSCTGFLASVARSTALDPAEFADQFSAMELVYPGAESLIASVIDALGSNPSPTDIETRITEAAPMISSYCRGQAEHAAS